MDSAKDQYKKVLEKNPNLAPTHMMLGTIYEMEKDYTQAEEHYRKALEVDPEFGAAANNLAYHLATRTDQYDAALQYAKKAKERFPEDPGVMDTLGFAYYKKELYGNAVNEFIDSLKQIPDNPIVRYHLGLAYNKKGNIELARKELSRALEINDKFPDAEKAKALLDELNKG
jgi:tetratricopeptide (TPR) repeat protein